LVTAAITDKYGRKPTHRRVYHLHPRRLGICPGLIDHCADCRAIFAGAGRSRPALVISGAIARDLWRGKVFADRLSVLMLVLGAAPILAPSLGGVILAFWNWHGVFWVLVGYGIIMLLALSRLPETSSASERAALICAIPPQTTSPFCAIHRFCYMW
jgi:DHA1 family bicyclomycin/chloramphenicol resistance-like MFS transporter